MTEPTIADAKALIERMKASKPQCDQCQLYGFCSMVGSEDDAELTRWYPSPSSAAWVRRCDSCEAGQRFPWASRLDAEKVLAFMLEQDGVFELAKLEALL